MNSDGSTGRREASAYIFKDEAIRILGIKPATLYTYVSRGWIRSRAAKGTKRRMFLRTDVEKLQIRSLSHSGVAARAEASMRYGEPIISSAITEVTSHGPRYRGKAAIDLALDRVSFECVCHLLWEGHLPKSSLVWPWEGRKLSPDVVIEALRLRLPPQDVLKLFSFLVLASGLASFGISDPTEGRTIKDAKD